MLHRLNALVLGLLGVMLTHPAWAGPFDVEGRPPTAATVTIAEVRPADEGPSSPMLDQLRGVVARFDSKRCLELRATADGPAVLLPPDAARFCIIHAQGKADTRTVEVLRGAAGNYYARDLYGADDAGQKASRLNSLKFAKLAATWPRYSSDFRPPRPSDVGAVVELSGPDLKPSVFTFDEDTISDRLYGGARRWTLGPTKRDLGNHSFMLRLPKGYDPRAAAGLLVYVDPGPATQWPQFTEKAADELGLIVIAPKRIGNGVFAPDRWQLAMDALETACTRHLVDPRRIYVTGISGGGQIATHLWMCFPDVFSGAVPVVALGSYQVIPIGNGTAWAATFGKPRAEFFKRARQQRCAAITGKQDFNERVVHLVQEFLTREGLNVRVDDYADMGHTAPTPERFAEAIRWVDAPRRTEREAEAVEARVRLAQAREVTDGAKRREALVEVTRTAPWTPAAWEAVMEIDPSLARAPK